LTKGEQPGLLETWRHSKASHQTHTYHLVDVLYIKSHFFTNLATSSRYVTAKQKYLLTPELHKKAKLDKGYISLQIEKNQ